MKIDIFYFLIYFTTWNIILVIFHKYTHKYINLLYTSFIILCLSFYISYIKPGYYIYYFNNKKYIVKGLYKLIFDIVNHLLVFIFILYNYHKYYRTHINYNTLLVSIYLFIIYALFVDIQDIYNVKFCDLLYIHIFASIIYYIIFII